MSPAAPQNRFAQHTRLVAAPGKRDELVAEFLAAAGIQRDNPAWEQGRRHPQIRAWAATMPGRVSGPPESARLAVAGGTGLG